MSTGFVLITTEPGKEQSVRSSLDAIEHVTSRWMLFGEYDLIAKIEAEIAKNESPTSLQRRKR